MSASMQEVFDKVEKPLEHVSAETLFGKPIEANGRTVVPVAKLTYRAMGGGRMGGTAKDGKDGAWSGGGGRLRGSATPFGALEITEAGTRFIPFLDTRRIIGAAALAFIFGSLIAGRRSR